MFEKFELRFLYEPDALAQLGIMAGGLAAFGASLYGNPRDWPWFIWAGLAAGAAAVLIMAAQIIMSLPELFSGLSAARSAGRKSTQGSADESSRPTVKTRAVGG